MGLDLHINYKKFAKAFTFIHSNPECHFLATNSDVTYPAGKSLYPGTGSFVKGLAAALGKEPIVLGKPHPSMLEVVINK
jgi:4-nitrophenyl phosphatase